MNTYLKDIKEQPYDISSAVEYYYSNEFKEKLRSIGGLKYSKIIFTGMGSSHFGSIGASLFLNENKINSFVMSAGQLLHYGLNIIDEETLLVMISQSGESAEIIGLLDKIGDNVKVIGITNNPESTLAKNASESLILHVPDEESVTTRTYLATLIVTYILSRYLVSGQYESIRDKIIECISSLQGFIDDNEGKMDKMNDLFNEVKFISCIGRGASYGSAMAGGLFLKEVSKFPSEGLDSAEFRHGPLEIVDKSFGAVVFAPEGKTCGLSLRIASDISSRGGKVLMITDEDIEASNTGTMILKYNHVDEYLSPFVEIAGVQLLCCVLAEKSGYIPGEFRWSHKITNQE